MGGAKSHLETTPIPTRDARETEPELPLKCLSVSWGDTGQQGPAAGIGALAAADLGHTACGMSPLGGGHQELYHRATEQSNYTKEILTLLRKFWGPRQISQPGDPAKGVRILRQFDFGGQCDLITELP